MATTAFVGAEIADKAYSKTQLDAGQLDNRYYTETELLNGALDNRYYTETEIDTLYSTTVKLTENQTIAGVKTFTSSPIVPTPTTVNQAVNKQYVDNMVISSNGSNSYAVAMAIVFGS